MWRNLCFADLVGTLSGEFLCKQRGREGNVVTTEQSRWRWEKRGCEYLTPTSSIPASFSERGGHGATQSEVLTGAHG